MTKDQTNKKEGEKTNADRRKEGGKRIRGTKEGQERRKRSTMKKTEKRRRKEEEEEGETMKTMMLIFIFPFYIHKLPINLTHG